MERDHRGLTVILRVNLPNASTGSRPTSADHSISSDHPEIEQEENQDRGVCEEKEPGTSEEEESEISEGSLAKYTVTADQNEADAIAKNVGEEQIPSSTENGIEFQHIEVKDLTGTLDETEKLSTGTLAESALTEESESHTNEDGESKFESAQVESSSAVPSATESVKYVVPSINCQTEQGCIIISVTEHSHPNDNEDDVEPYAESSETEKKKEQTEGDSEIETKSNPNVEEKEQDQSKECATGTETNAEENLEELTESHETGKSEKEQITEALTQSVSQEQLTPNELPVKGDETTMPSEEQESLVDNEATSSKDIVVNEGNSSDNLESKEQIPTTSNKDILSGDDHPVLNDDLHVSTPDDEEDKVDTNSNQDSEPCEEEHNNSSDTKMYQIEDSKFESLFSEWRQLSSIPESPSSIEPVYDFRLTRRSAPTLIFVDKNQQPVQEEENKEENQDTKGNGHIPKLTTQKSVVEFAEDMETRISIGDWKDTEQYNGGSNRAVDFETAISLTGYGLFSILLLFASGMCFIAVTFEMLGTGYLLPALECDFRLTIQEKGLVNSIQYVGMIIGSHFWGFMADTYGRRKVLIITLAMIFVSTFIASFSQWLWMLLVFRCLGGFFLGAPSSVMFAYIGELHSSEHRARVICWLGIFASVAAMSLPGVAWLVLTHNWQIQISSFTYNSWRIFLVLCTLPNLISALLLFFFPDSPKYMMSCGRSEDALETFRKIYTMNTRKPPETYPVQMLIQERDRRSTVSEAPSGKSLERLLKIVWLQTKPLFVPPLVSITLLLCFTQYASLFGHNGLGLWIPELFKRMHDFSNSYPNRTATICEVFYNTSMTATPEEHDMTISQDTCAIVIDDQVFVNTLTIGLTIAVANLVAGLIVNKLGKKPILIFCLFVSSAAAFGVSFVDNNMFILVSLCMLVGLTATGIGLINSIFVDLSPTHLRAMAISITMIAGRFGVLTGSLSFGQLLEVNCNVPFLLVGALLLGAALLSFLIPKTKNAALG